MARILLVEDDKNATANMVELLNLRGHKTIVAYNAKEALKHLREEEIDLAIIDLILPDTNGNDLCGVIRHDTTLKDLPIIISTGVGDDSTREASKKLGADEFLSKPYSVEDLLMSIKKCLDKKPKKI